jgi:Macrophage migration inhibitory factor (MIF)
MWYGYANEPQIQDEYTFITDLSYTLSTRYQRPESSILITVSHSACLLFGGSFDPAYIIAITALQSQLQLVTNKRNAALIQKAMEDALGVVPDRGLVKFMPIAEENLATNGRTVAGEIEDLERETSEDNSNIRRTLSRGKRRQSNKSLRNLKISSPLPTHDEQMTPPVSAQGIGSVQVTPSMPAMPAEKSAMDRKAEKVQKMSRRKSFIASMFGKGGDR